MRDYRILPGVASDLAEAADWYDREGYEGLGDRFITAFRAHLVQLRQTGEVHRTVYADFRRVLLKPFPYALYYRYHGDLLVVALVIHAARNDRLVRSKLRGRLEGDI